MDSPLVSAFDSTSSGVSELSVFNFTLNSSFASSDVVEVSVNDLIQELGSASAFAKLTTDSSEKTSFV